MSDALALLLLLCLAACAQPLRSCAVHIVSLGPAEWTFVCPPRSVP